MPEELGKLVHEMRMRENKDGMDEYMTGADTKVMNNLSAFSQTLENTNEDIKDTISNPESPIVTKEKPKELLIRKQKKASIKVRSQSYCQCVSARLYPRSKSRFSRETKICKTRLTKLQPSENIIGVTDLSTLEKRLKKVREKVDDLNRPILEHSKPSRMEWVKYDRNCLIHVKRRFSEQVHFDKLKVSKLMMEFEQAEKVDRDAKRAEFKNMAMSKTNQNVVFK